MKKLNITITIDGKEYPCRPTMGAMLRFKRETGREVTEIDGASMSDLTTYLYCCIASASKHDGIDFNLSLMDFADGIDPDDLTAWAAAISQSQEVEADAEGGDAKKN